MKAANRWTMLILGMSAQAAGSAFMYGIPFLVPDLRSALGLDLAEVGLIVSAPSVGMVLTLVAWGAAADRWGERLVMSIGLGIAGVFAVLAATTTSLLPLGLVLVVAGAAASSVVSASGRVVLGWFPPERRGIAMAWRQTAHPLGVTIAGFMLPPVAAAWGIGAAFLSLGGLCLVATLLVVLFVVDPPRHQVQGAVSVNPYRRPILYRIHTSAALHVVGQFTVAAFGPVYLVYRGWSPAAAGAVFAIAGFAGAATRLAAGRWSDAIGDRLSPVKWLALANGAALLATAVFLPTSVGAVLVIIASIMNVSTNGLTFTAAAEIAGQSWAGRTLGVHTTAQNAIGAVAGPVMGSVIAARGFGVGFAVAAVFPVMAAVAVWTRRRPSVPVEGRTSGTLVGSSGGFA
ncbi:MFS transporter [Allocatelliglobosispora scoriae]|uniref:MFS transporter n=1 Tax=Allocatelliglobosispora scoriae TaxID=643052 RepID=UPI001C86F6A8|nr:MFS transporter [Allocatelliglobosispora scoriae]